MNATRIYINLQTRARPPAFLAQVPQLSATDAAATVIVSAAVAAEYLLAKRASGCINGECNIDRAQIFDWKLETWIGGGRLLCFATGTFQLCARVNKLSTWTHRW